MNTEMQSENRRPVEAMVTGSLGLVRGLGRHGIPIILLAPDHASIARYSKYITKRLACPDPNTPEAEHEVVKLLVDYGKQANAKIAIIPVNDMEALTLSRNKEELEQFYFIPIASFDAMQKLVNKKNFYKLLAQMSVPHPKTYFPEDIAELGSMGQEIDYPYIIKPAYSPIFAKEFHRKCFVINNSEELEQAAEKLTGKNMEVMIQEIIPGNEIYMLYTYFNSKSEPIATCGYDKLRQFPPDIGCGSLCRSAWRDSPIDQATHVLRTVKYHGIAEPEFKRDPRDGEYKLLEINARISTQSRLPAACGVDIEYIAYLDATGQAVEVSPSPSEGVVWVDDFYDTLSCLMQWKRGKLGVGELFSSLGCKKVHSVAAWDDPIPYLIFPFILGISALKRLFYEMKSVVRKRGGQIEAV